MAYLCLDGFVYGGLGLHHTLHSYYSKALDLVSNYNPQRGTVWIKVVEPKDVGDPTLRIIIQTRYRDLNYCLHAACLTIMLGVR